MIIEKLTLPEYDEKIQNEYGFSPAEYEEHKRELEGFFIDRQLENAWNEENTADLENLVAASQF